MTASPEADACTTFGNLWVQHFTDSNNLSEALRLQMLKPLTVEHQIESRDLVAQVAMSLKQSIDEEEVASANVKASAFTRACQTKVNNTTSKLSTIGDLLGDAGVIFGYAPGIAGLWSVPDSPEGLKRKPFLLE